MIIVSHILISRIGLIHTDTPLFCFQSPDNPRNEGADLMLLRDVSGAFILIELFFVCRVLMIYGMKAQI